MKNHSTKRTTILAVLLSVFLFQQAASKIGKYVANIFDYSLIDSYNFEFRTLKSTTSLLHINHKAP